MLGNGTVAVEVPLTSAWDGGTTTSDLAMTRLVLSDPRGRALTLEAAPALGGADSGPVREVLAEAAPNPMSDLTRISYSVSDDGPVRVTVYDASGRQVRELWNGAQLGGSHTLHWDGRDDAGARVAAGVYFVRVQTNIAGDSRKILVLR